MTLIREWDEYGGHRDPDEVEVAPEVEETDSEPETPTEPVAEPVPAPAPEKPVARKRTPRKQRRVPSAAALKAAQAKLQ
jgi:hypothetical protein